MSGLKPRAVAVLCALRNGALTTRQICNRIGDRAINETHDLLSDMSAGHVRRPDLRMTGDMMVGCACGLWRLTSDGIGWLQTNGLDAHIVPARVEGMGGHILPVRS